MASESIAHKAFGLMGYWLRDVDTDTWDMDTFRKICRHHWKERLKIRKITKFESDLLKTYGDIAP